jgi:hypothetical protein
MNKAPLILLAVVSATIAASSVVRAQSQGGWFQTQQPAQAPTSAPTPTSTSTVPPGVVIVDPQPAPYPTQQPQPYVAVQPTAPPQPQPQPQPTAWKSTKPASEDEESEGMTKSSMKLELGGAYRRLLGLNVAGGDLRLGVGPQNNRLGHYAMVDFFYGATENSLRTWSVMIGYNLDVRVNIVRLGLGLEGGALVVRRASLDKRMYSWGGGAYLHAGADIVSFGRNGYDALYVDVRFGGSLHYGGVGFWGPSLMLGFRF